MNRIGPQAKEEDRKDIVSSKFKTPPLRIIIVVSVLLLSAAINGYVSKPDIALPRKCLADFPKELGGWTSISEQIIDSRSMDILQVDDYFMRNYRNPKGELIGFYIGYFKSQREGKGIHSPRQCLPGAGWVPIDIEIFRLKLSNHNPTHAGINKYLMGKGLDRQLYLFWYQGRSRIYASEYWNKIFLIWDSLTKKRTDGALIRLNSPVAGDPVRTLQTQTEFIDLFLPLLKEYIPD